jgi:Zn-finger nucleic acid-binding protein
MEALRFDRNAFGEVSLDVCWDCHGIWFDQYESAALTPGAVMQLFRLIHEHRDRPARTLADAMACPHCKAGLVLTQDVQRTNRIAYHRCPNGHGRLTSFMQFLREKQFVRSLSPMEIDGLKATVKQVRCSACGAPVDLARDAACAFCRSPLAVLDAAAVEKALNGLTDAERKRTAPGKVDIDAAFGSVLAAHRNADRGSLWTRDISSMQTTPALVDLVVAGIGHLLDR